MTGASPTDGVRAGREPGKALLGLAFIQARIFPSGYGVFGRKSSVFWQNGTRQALPVMDHRIAAGRRLRRDDEASAQTGGGFKEDMRPAGLGRRTS
jgi:hypothetical protein